MPRGIARAMVAKAATRMAEGLIMIVWWFLVWLVWDEIDFVVGYADLIRSRRVSRITE